MAGGQDVSILNVGTENVDIAVLTGDLVADNGLENAVAISLFTDRYVSPEELPEGVDPRGWWADAISDLPADRIGSRLWLLARGKINTDTANKMKDYADEALAWMLDAGLAARILTSTTVIFGQGITLSISIYKPTGENIPFKYLWDGQRLKATG